MGFIESINGFLRLCNLSDAPYRITALGNSGVFIEGVLKICDLKTERIILAVKGGKISFYGKGLSIGSYVERDLSIVGRVEKIEWQA
ncbi:MAG: YabP/YqfC family sporulation protein [Clostridia bacterium]|nr:YabP/YqfC family sporulation protein [Clostridia bacterium]